VKAKRTAQEAAYARRTAATIIRDALRLAQERVMTESSHPLSASRYFWQDEVSRLRWTLEILRTHPPGRFR